MGLFKSIANVVASPIGGSGLTDLIGKDTVIDALTGGAMSQKEANQQNVALARENRDWSESMSNSAYQRAMADMRKAGLNPMLAYSQGGASTPSTQNASVAPASVGQGLFNSAKAIATGIPQIQNMQADTQLKQANTEVSSTQATLNNANTQKALANATQSNQAAHESFTRMQKIQAEVKGAHAQSRMKERADMLEKQRESIDKMYSEADAHAERISGALGTVTNAVKALKPGVTINKGARYAPPLTGTKKQWRNAEE